MREPDISDIMVSGLMCLLALFGIILFGLLAFSDPKVFSIIVGGVVGAFGFIFISGWCVEHRYDFLEIFKKSAIVESVIEQRSPFKNPILEKLWKLEQKHHMTTIHFMNFVENNIIPSGMDNLDYIEWVSLVNELPGLNVEKAEENI